MIKLPVYLIENSWDTVTIYEANNTTLCVLRLDDEEVTEENQDEKQAEQLSKAKMIVNSLNKDHVNS